MSEPTVIHLQAQTAKFTTLVDGTKRIYLDMIEPASPEAITAILATMKPGVIVEWAGVLIDVQAKPIEEVKNERRNPRHFTPYAKTGE